MDKQKRLEIARWSFASVVVFVLVMSMAHQQVQEGGVAPEMLGETSAGTAFEYFPAQYVNQARESEAHIQAF